MYDLVGDIHGHADALESLLAKLGYVERNGVYRHESRKLIFLGDFIDRGPKISRVLQIAHRMVEEQAALAILGNHEVNALAYQTPDPYTPDGFIRPHTSKNMHQHSATLEQLTSDELQKYLGWFRSLPLWIELDGLRVVHACWDDQCISKLHHELQSTSHINDSLIERMCSRHGDLFDAVDVICKGKEADLPAGLTMTDKDGNVRYRFRTRWYLSPNGLSYQDYAFEPNLVKTQDPLDSGIVDYARPYPLNERPVFVGHYWLRSESPSLLASNVACLDYSVAKDGFLCAYRWDGEMELNAANFVW